MKTKQAKRSAAPVPPEGSTPPETGAEAREEKTRKRGHAKGCGSLILRGNIYQARWVVNGKVYVRSTKTGIKKEAEKKLQEFTAEYRTKDEEKIVENLSARVQGVRAEIARINDGKPALALIAAWSAYEKAQNRPDSGADTLSMYQSQFGRLCDWVRENHPDATEMRHITQEIADGFMEYIGARFSANTFNKYRAFFICAWNVLKDAARLTCNPWEQIRRKIQIAHTRRELTVDELRRVCGSLEGEMRLLFAVGIYTGLRLGDCARLDWGAVDLARGRIALIPHKTQRHSNGKPVIIPLHSVLAAMLAETPEEKRRGAVMPGIAADYARDTSALSTKIQGIFEANGIRTQAAKASESERARVDVGFHSLRHTYVSMCANAGVPLAVVQSIVGHTSPAMTLHYYHESDAALNSAVAALPDIAESRGAGASNAPIIDADADGSGIMDDFRAIVGRMTPEQRERARAYLAATK